MSIRSIKDVDVEGKRVLIRVDFNVPLKDGTVVDDTRIRSALPTIQHLLIDKAKQIIIISHLGRPKGKVVPELKMDPVAKKLGELFGKEITKLDGCIDVDIPKDARIVLLENLRCVGF